MPLQTYQLDYARGFSTPDGEMLAQQKAYSLSMRASYGWCLFDGRGAVLESNGALLGVDTEHLLAALKRHSAQARKLYVTVLPVMPAFDGARMMAALEPTQIDALAVGQFVADKAWSDWLASWSGTLEVCAENIVVEQVNRGFWSLRLKQRPWVTCVALADLTGTPIALAAVSEHRLFVTRLQTLLRQAQAVLASPQTQPPLSKIVEQMQCSIHRPLYSSRQPEEALAMCVAENKSHAILMASSEDTQRMLDAGLVDECFYFVANLSPSASERRAPSLDLAGWDILTAEHVGSMGCLFMKKTATCHLPAFLN